MRIIAPMISGSKFAFVEATNSARPTSFSRVVTWTLILFSWTIVVAAAYNPYQPQVIFGMSLFHCIFSLIVLLNVSAVYVSFLIHSIIFIAL